MDLDDNSSASLFDDVQFPSEAVEAPAAGETAILRERRLLETMPREDLIRYIEELHARYRSMEKDVSFLSWEFRDSLDNFTHFSRAASLAHKLNAADLDSVADIATREMPQYFQCDWAALFLYSVERMRFELCRASEPVAGMDAGAGRDDFLFRLFTGGAYPFIAEHVADRGAVELEGGRETLADAPAWWTRGPGAKALVCPLRVKQPGADEPLILGGLVIGGARGSLGAKDAEVSAMFSDLLSGSLYTARLMRRLNALTIVDPLTRIYNRRHLIAQLGDAMIQAGRQGHPLSIAMVDIDKFKSFNDRYGHVRGDEALRGVASTLRAGIRKGVDLVARYGGEEFMLVMPFTDLDKAFDAANRIRTSVKRWSTLFDGRELSVTCSFGVAEYEPGESLEGFIDRADASLYQAKKDGRDRVCAAAGACRRA